ncbi:MAG: exodeoxyribonuclease VII small subunit [Ruminococcus sp.]|nr:exodeoxyribonuclease VII small subunit [Ruminococcus sp.]
MKTHTYEESMQKLEQIVSRLESGEATLDESLKLFEEGAKLAAFCSKALDTAEQKITTLAQDTEKTE